ncbi:MAG: cupredoxin domain-containing protein [Dehalococcoidia bacterium]|nr:cupredoxin domain-containing protein [Dehalococcoidia bacterium]
MRKRMARVALLVVAVGAMAALVACGGSDDKKESGSSSSSASSSSGGSIKVELSEWAVKPAATSAKAGDVKFEVTNKGAAPHEFVVIKTDTAQDKLPVTNGAVDEKQVPPVGRTANIAAGKEEDKSFNLTAGKYVLLCNIPAHYGQGMHVAFTVE